jgi:DNA-binding transcriptional MerR regulator
MTIGEFAERSRLSIKALRIYDELGLLAPAEVDAATGYRRYDESQLDRARQVAVLRRLDMPLGRIAEIVDLEPAAGAKALADWWTDVEAELSERRALVSYLQSRFNGEEPPMRAVELRTIPERKVLSINRHVTLPETDAFFRDSFARLRALSTGLEGIAGAPFLIFYGEVSEDGNGPMELCRPVILDTPDVVEPNSDVEVRVEPEHDEAYVRLTKRETAWPAMLPFCDALEAWARDHGRQPSGALRQVLVGDRRDAADDAVTCHLSIALR